MWPLVFTKPYFKKELIMNDYRGKNILANPGSLLNPRGFQHVQQSGCMRNGTGTGEVLIFILDRSNSMDEYCGSISKLRAAQNAILATLKTRLRQGFSDLTSLIIFNDHAEVPLLLSQVADSQALITKAVQSVHIDGGTDINSGLLFLSDHLQVYRHGRPIHAIVFSDGQGHTGSPLETAARLKGQSVILETVGVGHTPMDIDEPLLKNIASIVNGKVLYRFVRDSREMEEYFVQEISNRLVRR
jgi:Mg-chelatase subunit ChlD